MAVEGEQQAGGEGEERISQAQSDASTFVPEPTDHNLEAQSKLAIIADTPKVDGKAALAAEQIFSNPLFSARRQSQRM